MNEPGLDVTGRHRMAAYDLCALWHTLKIERPDLFKQIEITDARIQLASKQIVSALVPSRFALQAEAILREHFNVECQVPRLFPHLSACDIKIGEKQVIVCHPPNSYYEQGELLGAVRLRVRLLKHMQFEVFELDREFFTRLSHREKIAYIESTLLPKLKYSTVV